MPPPSIRRSMATLACWRLASPRSSPRSSCVSAAQPRSDGHNLPLRRHTRRPRHIHPILSSSTHNSRSHTTLSAAIAPVTGVWAKIGAGASEAGEFPTSFIALTHSPCRVVVALVVSPCAHARIGIDLPTLCRQISSKAQRPPRLLCSPIVAPTAPIHLNYPCRPIATNGILYTVCSSHQKDIPACHSPRRLRRCPVCA